MMTGAEIIAKALKDLGVRRVFIFPGGTVAPLLDALQKNNIDYICPRNEQGAGYGAIGAAKISGCTQVILVTSGPGATNLVSPIADAYYDSIPILAFTGQVGMATINFEKKLRQTGFQETDTVGIYSPIVKKAVLFDHETDLYSTVQELFNLCKDGRPGPVVIDLPMDVQRTEKSEDISSIACSHKTSRLSLYSDDELINRQGQEIINEISKCHRPLILVGNGAYISKATKEIREFVEKFNLPVVSSMPGVGVIPSDHPLYFGFIGHTGEFYANLAAYFSDLLIVFGARLDLRQIGTEISSFIKNKKIIRIDIDKNELEFGKVKGDLNINDDLKHVLNCMLKVQDTTISRDFQGWIELISDWKEKYPSKMFYNDLSLSSYEIITKIDDFTRSEKVIVSSGVGTHQQLVPRYFTFNYPDRIWLTSAGHGTMGFDLPVMIGALTESEKHKTGIVFAGDGSIQMNIQELATINELNLPVKIFVLDNKRLGIVSQFQKLNWQSDPSTGDKKNSSFSAIAKAYGLKGFDIFNRNEINDVLPQVFCDQSPVLVHCHIDSREDVLPMLLGGQHLNEMYPFKDKVWM